MRLSLEIVGVPEVVQGIEEGYFRMYLAASKQMGVEMLGLRNHVVMDHLNGPTGPTTLRQVSGNLARSIDFSVENENTASVLGLVGVSENSSTAREYAIILHNGGTTRAHVIEARKAQSLAFMGGGGQMIFRRKVNHPGSKIPARPYLTSALAEQAEQIKASLTAAMLDSTK